METKFLTRKGVAARYSVTTRCVRNWEDDEKLRLLGFPEFVEINGRDYCPIDGLDEFDRRCAARGRRAEPVAAEPIAAE